MHLQPGLCRTWVETRIQIFSGLGSFSLLNCVLGSEFPDTFSLNLNRIGELLNVYEQTSYILDSLNLSIGESPSICPFLKNNGPKAPKGPRVHYFS